MMFIRLLLVGLLAFIFSIVLVVLAEEVHILAAVGFFVLGCYLTYISVKTSLSRY